MKSCFNKIFYLFKDYRIISKIKIMPVRVDKISVDFENQKTGTINVVTWKCYRCKQVKDIDLF